MQLFFFILFSSKILGIALGTYYFKSLTIPYRILYFQICTAFATEAAGAYIGLVLGQHNIWLFNFYLLIEIWLVSIPAFLLVNNVLLKKISLSLLISSTCIWLANIYYVGIETPANWYFLYYCIAVLIIYLFLLFDNGIFNKKKLHQQPLFWMAISSILFFACMIPYKGFEKYLFANDMEMARVLFNINTGLNFFRYLFLAISFYLLGMGAKKNILDKPDVN